MLLRSSFRKELARSFGTTVVVLTTIVMTVLLIRTLGQASRGSVDPTAVILVLGYVVLGNAPTILTLSLFMAIASTLSRMYRDSEMVIWFSSGRGLGSFIWPLMRFAWPVWIAIFALLAFAWPWAQEKSQQLRDRFDNRGDLMRVEAGQFESSADGTRVFFIDKDSVSGKTAGEVFIAATARGKRTVTTAQSAVIERVGADGLLVLSNGQQLESELEGPGLKLSEFEKYESLVDETPLVIEHAVPPQTLSTLTLIAGHTPPFLAELSWRLGLALAAVNLVLIGLAVAAFTPRIGRNGNLVFSLFTFIAYFNLVNVGGNRIASGNYEFWRFMLALHGGTFVATTLLLLKLHWNLTLGATLRYLRQACGLSAARALLRAKCQ